MNLEVFVRCVSSRLVRLFGCIVESVLVCWLKGVCRLV